jgi:NAD(P)-dependent dehydrogenase (short-subunit alcohol dehydrogenase family)
MNTLDKFRLDGKTVLITGGSGLMGKRYAIGLLDVGANVVLLDINSASLEKAKVVLSKDYDNTRIMTQVCDITSKDSLAKARDAVCAKYGSVNVLINNAANNPKVEDTGNGKNWSRFENFELDVWNADIAVGLTGAFLCSQVFGREMALHGGGVIINISSDLGLIAPDQRIYEKSGLSTEKQNVKPVTYSVVKHAIIGLTKYIATYWNGKNVRCNAICPGGVYNGQNGEFLKKLTNLIPMGRMANIDEYQAAIVFLASEASAYMTGGTLIMEGGRTCW